MVKAIKERPDALSALGRKPILLLARVLFVIALLVLLIRLARSCSISR